MERLSWMIKVGPNNHKGTITSEIKRQETEG